MNKAITPGTIKFLTGQLAGRTYQLTKPIVYLGCGNSNDVVIPDSAVAYHHARITWEAGGWKIKRLSPRNVLTINEQEEQEAMLKDNDIVGLGEGTAFLLNINIVSKRQTAGQPSVIQQVSRGPVTPSPTGMAMLPGKAVTPQATAAMNAPVTITVSPVAVPQDNSTPIVVARPVPQYLQSDVSGPILTPRPEESISDEFKLKRVTNLVNYGDTQTIPLIRKETLSDSDEFDENIELTEGYIETPERLPEIHPIPLGAPVITIGRAPDNVVVLNHPQVSAHHARLDLTEQGYCIIDHGSTNHVYINEQNVTRHILTAGDEIRIGPFKLTYTGKELIQQNESHGVRIDALELYKEGYRGQVLLHNISLSIQASKFVAIVGGSGTGKTTLMDALNGLRPAPQGTVFYNGQNYYRHPDAFKTQLGYVPQDNIVHNDLTVECALYYAARLRLPSDFTREQINKRIDAVLEDMEITEQRHQMVSKLSGGQRKRVSIAMELLANPSVFFLDEPTSGLDPGLDRKMMQLLRKLANKGHTVVLVTHATSHINMCDYVCFLARGGRLAYYGTPDGARAYFGKSDFAEIYSDLEPTKENPNIPVEVEERFRQSPQFKRYLAMAEICARESADRAGDTDKGEKVEKKPIRFSYRWMQFYILVARYLELLKNDKTNLILLLLQAPIIGLILLFLASGNTFNETGILSCPHHANLITNSGPVSNDCQQELQALGALNASAKGRMFKVRMFPGETDLQIVNNAMAPGSGSSSQKILLIIVLASILSGCTDGAREIVKEAPIYRRERTVNLGLIPYMFSKFVVLGTLCLLQSFTLVLLVSIKSPFTHSIMLPPFLEVYISAALASLAGLMIGLTISAIVPNSDRALSIVPIVIIPQIIFSNVLFSLDNPPILQFLGGIFPARWAMAAMGSTVGLHGDKLRTDSFSYRSTLLSLTSQSEAVHHLLLCWFVLVLMIVVMGIMIGILLKKKDARAWKTYTNKQVKAA